MFFFIGELSVLIKSTVKEAEMKTLFQVISSNLSQRGYDVDKIKESYSTSCPKEVMECLKLRGAIKKYIIPEKEQMKKVEVKKVNEKTLKSCSQVIKEYYIVFFLVIITIIFVLSTL